MLKVGNYICDVLDPNGYLDNGFSLHELIKDQYDLPGLDLVSHR
jgi:hypothetical protein